VLTLETPRGSHYILCDESERGKRVGLSASDPDVRIKVAPPPKTPSLDDLPSASTACKKYKQERTLTRRKTPKLKTSSATSAVAPAPVVPDRNNLEELLRRLESSKKLRMPPL
jgi:hypothetical protein